MCRGVADRHNFIQRCELGRKTVDVQQRIALCVIEDIDAQRSDPDTVINPPNVAA